MILDNNDETPRPRANFSKKIGINLLIILVGTTLVNKSCDHYSHSAIIYNCMLVSAHVFVCFLISLYWFIRKRWSEGQAYLLASLVVLAVGFSSCLGGERLFS